MTSSGDATDKLGPPCAAEVFFICEFFLCLVRLGCKLAENGFNDKELEVDGITIRDDAGWKPEKLWKEVEDTSTSSSCPESPYL